MFGEKYDYVKTVQDSISGVRPVDEETYSSVTVLAERLENLKRASSLFAGVTFSNDVAKLSGCKMMSAAS